MGVRPWWMSMEMGMVATRRNLPRRMDMVVVAIVMAMAMIVSHIRMLVTVLVPLAEE